MIAAHDPFRASGSVRLALQSDDAEQVRTLNNSTHDPRVGKTVAQYDIVAKLGGGAMGVVYKARDKKLGRFVALKFLPPEWSHDETAKQRFIREAQAASAADHRNICTIHDIETTDDRQSLFIVMAHYPGETLKQKLERGPVSVDEALEIGAQIVEGLAKAHSQGVVHRDIKPSNLMITDDGVKILDFGLAKFANSLQLTIVGSTIGTVAYMSPEQAMGQEADARSDVWAVGVVLYEMLAGEVPFKGGYPEATFYAIKEEPPPPLRRPGTNIPQPLEQLVLRALQKKPEDRFQTARDLARELRRHQGRNAPLDREAPRDAKTGRQLSAVSVGSLPSASIAVLPFRDISPEKNQDWFCEGLTEELISALTKITGLRVAARSSALRFKNQAADPRQIGETLNVATVLDGSVRKSGNRLRITVELLSSADGCHLWRERFDRDLEDVFAVQDEIAGTVVNTLKGKLATEEAAPLVSPHTGDLKAYMFYLEGRYHWNKRTEQELKKSVDCFEHAIARDPNYAQAYVGVADALVTLGTYGALSPVEVIPGAERAVQHALDLNAYLAEAYVCRGCLQSVYKWSWAAAEHDFERAIELNRRYPSAHHWYAINYLVPMCRFDEAAEQLCRALELDPVSLPIKTSLGMSSYFAGKHHQACDELSKAVELDETFVLARVFRGQTYTALGKFDEAARELEAACRLSPSSPDVLAALGYLCGVSGAVERARNIMAELTRLSERRYVSPAMIAQVHAGLGDKAETFNRLEDAAGQRASDLAWLAVRPAFAALRAEPRFVSLLKRMGLPT